jgi:hypothetical protein
MPVGVRVRLGSDVHLGDAVSVEQTLGLRVGLRLQGLR